MASLASNLHLKPFPQFFTSNFYPQPFVRSLCALITLFGWFAKPLLAEQLFHKNLPNAFASPNRRHFNLFNETIGCTRKGVFTGKVFSEYPPLIPLNAFHQPKFSKASWTIILGSFIWQLYGPHTMPHTQPNTTEFRLPNGSSLMNLVRSQFTPSI